MFDELRHGISSVSSAENFVAATSFDNVVHRRGTDWAERLYPAILMPAQRRRLTAPFAGTLAQPCSFGKPVVHRVCYFAAQTKTQTAQLLPHFNRAQMRPPRFQLELARQLVDDAIPAIVALEQATAGKARLQGAVDCRVARHQSDFKFLLHRSHSLNEELAGIHC